MGDQTQNITEPLNGGLVTARDPSILEPGELTAADNAVYMPNDPAIHKVKGRTKYNATAIPTGPNVKGLRYLEFDGGTALLAAHTDSNIYLSEFLDETGTFGTLTPITGVGSGDSLDAVQFENKYVLLIGAGQNTVVNADATSRKHGLAPVYMDTLPTVGAGSWNTALGSGFYHFFVTEVVKDGFGTIESTVAADSAGNFSKTTIAALSAPATQSITVTRPAEANTNTTHWRVYMAGPTATPDPAPALIEFRLVAENVDDGTVGQTTVIGNGAFTGARDPGTAASAAWSNPNNALTLNNSGARSSVNLSTLNLTNFGFSGLTGTITGFQVFVRVRIPDYSVLKNVPKLIIDLTHNGVNFFPGGNIQYFLPTTYAGVVANYVTVVLGDQYDQWGRTGGPPPWALADVNGNAAFGVRLTYGLATTVAGHSNPIIDVDNVKIVVHTTGTSAVVNLTGQPFRTVVVSVGGITTAFGADGPPPVSTTGDVFEGQLVVNDIQDKSIIKYSLPGSIESFPFPYFLNFETKTEDQVTCIRRLGSKLIVGLKQGLYRVNYLPRESDAEFDRGRAYEAISESGGIMGPQASALFSPEGGPMFLAYVSHSGLRYTDGFQSRPITKDIDWSTTGIQVRLPVAGGITDYLASSILVDYPKRQQLWFYYIAGTSTAIYKALVIHYSSMYQKEDGTFKVTGPIDIENVYSATRGRLGGDDVLMIGRNSGFVWIEDRGYSANNVSGPYLFNVVTREMYLAGLGQEFVVENVFVRHRADTTSTVTVTPTARRGANAGVDQATKTFTTANGGVRKLPFLIGAESLKIGLSQTWADGGNAIRITDIAVAVSTHGLPEPRTT